MRAIGIVCVLALAAAAGMAWADAADLERTLADLRSQLQDKQRLDNRGATRVELSQASGWLDAAGNAIKEEDEELCRRLFNRVRAQLQLIDELIALSKIEAQVAAVEKELSTEQGQLQKARAKLQEKKGKLNALRSK